MMIKMQLNITLKYSIMNILTIKEKIYLNAKKRYNIIQKNNEDDENDKNDALNQIVLFISIVFFVLDRVFLLNFKS